MAEEPSRRAHLEQMLRESLGQRAIIDHDTPSAMPSPRLASADCVVLDRVPAAVFDRVVALSPGRPENPSAPSIVALLAASERSPDWLRRGAHEVIREDWLNPDSLAMTIERALASRQTLQPPALAEQLRRLRMIFDTMTQFTGLLAPDGTVLEANRTSLASVGVTAEQVIGQKFWDTPWWSGSPLLQDQLRDAIARAGRGEAVRFDGEHPQAAGDPLSIDFSLTPIRDEAGEVVFLVPEGKDITTRHRLERELRTQQQKLHAVLSALEEGVLYQDHSGLVQLANASAERLLGLTFDEALGRTSSDPRWGSIREDGQPWPGEQHPSMVALRTGQPQRDQIMGIVHPHGERHWLSINAQPIAGLDGEPPLGVVVSFRDVTEQRLAAQRLQASEEAFRQLADNLPSVVLRFDSGGRLLYVNRAFTSTTGLEARHALHRTPAELGLLLGHSRASQQALERAFAGSCDEQTITWTGKHGVREFRVQTIPERGANGQIESALSLFADITEQVAELKSVRLRAEFEQQLIGIVSHDLRSPLHVISLSSGLLLRRDELAPDARRLATRIASNVERATRMVQDLLDFTKARLGGGLPISRSPHDLHQLVSVVIEEASASAPSREVIARYCGETGAFCDPDRISQLLHNLLANALAYSPADLPIEVTVDSDEDQVVLRVHNGGPPIPASLLPSLFQPLQRGVAQGSSNPRRSVGLGLFIVEQIARGHGGSISVRSDAQQGTTFEVRFPRREVVRSAVDACS